MECRHTNYVSGIVVCAGLEGRQGSRELAVAKRGNRESGAETEGEHVEVLSVGRAGEGGLTMRGASGGLLGGFIRWNSPDTDCVNMMGTDDTSRGIDGRGDDFNGIRTSYVMCKHWPIAIGTCLVSALLMSARVGLSTKKYLHISLIT